MKIIVSLEVYDYKTNNDVETYARINNVESYEEVKDCEHHILIVNGAEITFNDRISDVREEK